MTDKQYQAFLVLLMCCDPWPVPDDVTQSVMVDLADQEAQRRGYDNWIVAYHEFRTNP